MAFLTKFVMQKKLEYVYKYERNTGFLFICMYENIVDVEQHI